MSDKARPGGILGRWVSAFLGVTPRSRPQPAEGGQRRRMPPAAKKRRPAVAPVPQPAPVVAAGKKPRRRVKPIHERLHPHLPPDEAFRLYKSNNCRKHREKPETKEKERRVKEWKSNPTLALNHHSSLLSQLRLEKSPRGYDELVNAYRAAVRGCGGDREKHEAINKAFAELQGKFPAPRWMPARE